ncbi:hypothetical protein WA556_004789 [Blastocystis sp. ATCC 50177/Nand II]
MCQKKPEEAEEEADVTPPVQPTDIMMDPSPTTNLPVAHVDSTDLGDNSSNSDDARAPLLANDFASVYQKLQHQDPFASTTALYQSQALTASVTQPVIVDITESALLQDMRNPPPVAVIEAASPAAPIVPSTQTVEVVPDATTSHNTPVAAASGTSHNTPVAAASETSHNTPVAAASETSHNTPVAAASETSHNTPVAAASGTSHNTPVAAASGTTPLPAPPTLPLPVAPAPPSPSPAPATPSVLPQVQPITAPNPSPATATPSVLPQVQPITATPSPQSPVDLPPAIPPPPKRQLPPPPAIPTALPAVPEPKSPASDSEEDLPVERHQERKQQSVVNEMMEVVQQMKNNRIVKPSMVVGHDVQKCERESIDHDFLPKEVPDSEEEQPAPVQCEVLCSSCDRKATVRCYPCEHELCARCASNSRCPVCGAIVCSFDRL